MTNTTLTKKVRGVDDEDRPSYLGKVHLDLLRQGADKLHRAVGGHVPERVTLKFSVEVSGLSV